MVSRTSLMLIAIFMGSANCSASLETFEPPETNGATTFSQDGRTFTTSGDLIVEVDANLGSGGSEGWLGTRWAGNPVFGGPTPTPSSGNVGSITIDSGWSFVVNSFDAWTGADDGNWEQHGQVKFIGTLLDNSFAEVTLDIDQNTALAFQTGLSFSGTALDGASITALGFELVGAIGGQTNPSTQNGGVLDYFGIDNLDFTASEIETEPEPQVPEPASIITWMLIAAVGSFGVRRWRI